MSTIFPQTPQYQQIITISTNEYLMSSMAMFIFSATLAVHISCAYTGTKLLLKSPTSSLYLLNAVQAFFAVTCHLSAVSGYYFITQCHFKGFFNWIFYYVSNTIMELLTFVRLYNQEKISPGFLILGILLELAKLVIIILLEIGLNAYNGALQQCIISPPMSAFRAYMSTEVMIYAVQMCGIVYIVYNRYLQSKCLRNALSTNALGLTLASCVSGIFWFSLLLAGITFNLNPDVLFQTKWATSSKLFALQLLKIEKQRTEAALTQSKMTSGGDFESFPNSHGDDIYDLKVVSSSRLNEEIC
ncbi:hypothetical protein K7432_005051 [Basidiobolus ranarum]|uniref:Transmembrane protein n=1 Tax=Basidiobolus ranarum TaxID=34480 RepID=A0ABR2W3N6_9FUNG